MGEEMEPSRREGPEDRPAELQEGDLCPACKCCSLLWQECEACGGEGETEPGDLYAMDPLWYDEDDTEPCDICRGACGWLLCGGSCDENGKHAEARSAPESPRGSNPNPLPASTPTPNGGPNG